MTTEKAYMDTFREVGMEGTDPPLTVGPDSDALGMVRIFAKSDEAAEYWGRIDLCIPPAMARAMAKALMACADEAGA